MPGMSDGQGAGNPTVTSAFKVALVHQGLVVVLIVAVVGLCWNVLRAAQLRRAAAGEATEGASVWGLLPTEPAARRLLRVSFGLLWIFDGVLQGQLSMPLGLVPRGIDPAASTSASWVEHLVESVAAVWSYHPVSAAAATVWIQIGIGVWLLAAPRGSWSRLGGLVSLGWGLIVWVFGEAFGGVFAPGLTWLFGAPGAALFYCAAGVLVALPERDWASRRLGTRMLRLMGLFFVGMAVLQAWPGRGFWQGKAGTSSPGTLAGMVQQMAHTPQPRLVASLVAAFAGFDDAHGWAVNLFVVAALGTIGSTFLSARPAAVRAGVVAGVVLCLADWIFIEDLGFMGGVGTDPNSMIPMALLFIAGYVAVTRRPAVDGSAVVAISTASPPHQQWRERWRASPTYALRSIVALGAVGVTLLGAVPMAAAATDRHADPLLAEAVDGTPQATDTPAPAFALVDQSGRPVSLASLRGRTIGLTFLDPVCTSDCPLIAQEFREADGMLGSDARRVELLAIDANPAYLQPSFLAAFDRQEGLDGLSNWRYLTGPRAELEHLWAAYGCEVSYEPGGAMIDHSDIAYVIDARGRTRFILDADPGAGDAAMRSSFAVTLTNALKRALPSS